MSRNGNDRKNNEYELFHHEKAVIKKDGWRNDPRAILDDIESKD